MSYACPQKQQQTPATQDQATIDTFNFMSRLVQLGIAIVVCFAIIAAIVIVYVANLSMI